MLKDQNENNEVEIVRESNFKKTDDGTYEKEVIWSDNSGFHTETTVINKTVPSAGVIILTAVVFLLIGALIAGMIFFARFTDVRSIVDAISGSRQADATPIPTLEPQTTAEPFQTPKPSNTPDPSGHGGDDSGFNAIPDLYASNVSGIVIVQSYSGTSFRPSNHIGTGTGFLISENGYILTNAHVVKDANLFRVVTYSNKTLEAKLIGSDVRTDIAVLKIDDVSDMTVLRIGDSSAVRTGDFVFAIGHPTGDELSFTATFGMVGAINRSVVVEGVRNDYIQIDAAINPGNSGGPLFDMNGYVIGVNSAKTVIASYSEDGEPISAEGLAFALPINSAYETARKIIEEGGIKRPGIGISTILIDEETAEKYGIPIGVLVYTILEDGPGHLAGLHIDDIITEADGTPITDSDTLSQYIRTKDIGDTIELTVYRDGETLNIRITIGDLNSLGSKLLDDAYGGEKYGLR